MYLSFAVLCVLSGIAVYTAGEQTDSSIIYWTAGIAIAVSSDTGTVSDKDSAQKIAAGILCVVFAGEIGAMSVVGLWKTGPLMSVIIIRIQKT